MRQQSGCCAPVSVTSPLFIALAQSPPPPSPPRPRQPAPGPGILWPLPQGPSEKTGPPQAPGKPPKALELQYKNRVRPAPWRPFLSASARASLGLWPRVAGKATKRALKPVSASAPATPLHTCHLRRYQAHPRDSHQGSLAPRLPPGLPPGLLPGSHQGLSPQPPPGLPPSRAPTRALASSLIGLLLSPLGCCRASTKINVARLPAPARRSHAQPRRRFASGTLALVSGSTPHPTDLTDKKHYSHDQTECLALNP
jgi:hypothetical protein